MHQNYVQALVLRDRYLGDILRILKQVLKAFLKTAYSGKEKTSMQSTLATLLLVTSCVVLTCIVVDYAVITMEQTLQTNNSPQMEKIRNLENALLNQTENLFSQVNQALANETLALPQTTPQP